MKTVYQVQEKSVSSHPLNFKTIEKHFSDASRITDKKLHLRSVFHLKAAPENIDFIKQNRGKLYLRRTLRTITFIPESLRHAVVRDYAEDPKKLNTNG